MSSSSLPLNLTDFTPVSWHSTAGVFHCHPVHKYFYDSSTNEEPLYTGGIQGPAACHSVVEQMFFLHTATDLRRLFLDLLTGRRPRS